MAQISLRIEDDVKNSRAGMCRYWHVFVYGN